MLEGFRFHHIGYAVNNITETAALYSAAGFNASEVMVDLIQQTRICFISKEGNPCIELVEPLNEGASVYKILKTGRGGAMPYHICYEADDIEGAFDSLVRLRYTPLFRPVEAVAMNNRKICYFYRKEIGFIKVVSTR